MQNTYAVGFIADETHYDYYYGNETNVRGAVRGFLREVEDRSRVTASIKYYNEDVSEGVKKHVLDMNNENPTVPCKLYFV